MPTFNHQKLGKLKRIDSILRLFFNKKKYDGLIIDESDSVKEILIIGFLLIGDAVMYVPAFRILRKSFPNAKFTLVCGGHVKSIIEPQGLADDFVIVKCPWIAPFDGSFASWVSFFRSLSLVRKKRFDVAIDFRGDWRNIFYMNFSRSVRKVSFNFTGGEYMLTDVIVPDKRIVHFTEEACFFVKQLGCSFTESEMVPRLFLNESSRLYCESIIERCGLRGRTVIGVHPGSSQDVKKWDERKYADLIIRLANDKKDTTFLIFEGPGEAPTVNAIRNVIEEPGVVFHVIKEPLPNYINIVSLCDLMICNDSGAAHLAAAFNVATVIIFGNVNPMYVTPFGAENVAVVSHELECKPCFQSFCKLGTNDCIKGITIDEVFHSINNLITHAQ